MSDVLALDVTRSPRLGNERRRALEAELTDSMVPGTEEADTEVAETVHHRVWVRVWPARVLVGSVTTGWAYSRR